MNGTEVIRTRKVTGDDLVRSAVGRPRRIPRRRREEIVLQLASNLLGSVDSGSSPPLGRLGSFHLVLRALSTMDEWAELQRLSAGSDLIAILSLRSAAPLVLDILDRTVHLPGGNASLEGLIALTLHVWQDRTASSPEVLARGVEELEMSGEGSEVHEVVAAVLRPRLAAAVEEVTSRANLLAMMKELLPSGNDETFVEEVFLEYDQDLNRMTELLRRSKELQHIIDLMGKLDVEYGSKQDRARSFHTSEAYDLGLSKDIRYVLPVELLKLKDPTLKLLFFSQMLEGELLSYQLRGLNWMDEPDDRKGPVIALIDASGSMSGPPEVLAKAFLLMLAKRMEREGRDVKAILFAAQDWKLEINLVDKKKVARNLLDTLVRRFEGGTDFNSALRTGLETVSEGRWKGADVLLFTDGESRFTDQDLVTAWNEFKRKTRSKVYTLIVNNSSAGGLEQVSDRVWTLPMGTWDINGSPSHIIKLIAGEVT
jgi:uncharacterized protein with von Willebrand factor type A (vWA) domain